MFNYKTDSPEFLGNTSRIWKVTFVENSVNEPIPLSEFSLEALGYESSGLLEDRREYHAPIYDNTRTWDERILREIEVLHSPAPYEELPLEFAPLLLGTPLPELKCIDIPLEQVPDTSLLICFFDMNQRPSRHCLMQLVKQAGAFKKKEAVVVAVQVSQIDEKTINEWAKKNSIPFPIGTIKNNEEKKICFTWGVKSLPWLILTDKEHVVIAEGFGLDELEDKIRKSDSAQ